MKPTPFTCKVQSCKKLTETVFSLDFDIEPSLEFQGGQFLSVVVPGGPLGKDLRRAYSIASAPERRPIELCIKAVKDGPGTQYLGGLKPQDQFKVWAPYGNFVYHPQKDRYAFFIATGTGIAPFRSMLLSSQFKLHPPLGIFCLLGVRTEDEILYEQELSHLPGMQFIVALSQPKPHWAGFRGRVTDYLRSLGTQSPFPWEQTDYYLCGNGGMIQEVKTILAEKAVPKTSIYQEIYYK